MQMLELSTPSTTLETLAHGWHLTTVKRHSKESSRLHATQCAQATHKAMY